jgi:hypothetical protein
MSEDVTTDLIGRHTPGPWHMRKGSAWHIWPNEGVEHQRNLVADVRFDGEEGEANARLVAAAPDLLAQVHALTAKLAEASSELEKCDKCEHLVPRNMIAIELDNGAPIDDPAGFQWCVVCHCHRVVDKRNAELAEARAQLRTVQEQIFEAREAMPACRRQHLLDAPLIDIVNETVRLMFWYQSQMEAALREATPPPEPQ